MGGSETLATAAYQRLRLDVIAGVFPFGAKLKIRSLCERYGVSAAPMREALNRAAKDNLFVQSDQRGFTVAPLSVQDLDDILETRCHLNEIGLRRSIELGDSAWEERVLLAEYRLSRIPYDPVSTSPEWEQLHREFHASLLSACGIPRIIKYCDELFDSADRYRFMARVAQRQYEVRGDEHNWIMQATLERRADDAVRLLNTHFRETAARCRDQLLLKMSPTSPAADSRPS